MFTFKGCAIKSAVFFFFLLHAVSSSAQAFEVPINYVLLDSLSGDLTKDSIRELVVIYNIAPDTSKNGVARELIIYKLHAEAWKIWKRSTQAILGSKDGGMTGDPYVNMQIKNNTLRISHDGGSAWKWRFTDIYRFQNSEFYLIGYDSYSGKLCDTFTEMSFNLSTGKIIANKYTETCNDSMEPISKKSEKETWEYKNLKIPLQSRNGGTIVIVSPKNNWEFYLASGQD